MSLSDVASGTLKQAFAIGAGTLGMICGEGPALAAFSAEVLFDQAVDGLRQPATKGANLDGHQQTMR